MYKPIGRDKWLNRDPEKLEEKYYAGECDKDDKDFTGKITLWHEIVISDKLPK